MRIYKANFFVRIALFWACLRSYMPRSAGRDQFFLHRNAVRSRRVIGSAFDGEFYCRKDINPIATIRYFNVSVLCIPFPLPRTVQQPYLWSPALPTGMSVHTRAKTVNSRVGCAFLRRIISCSEPLLVFSR